ncbi:MAG: hypothetical protein K9N23_08825 [Akkermansiaceae bacterium]|nr:hypothetical protein [Akkermansiaceae bacterium]
MLETIAYPQIRQMRLSAVEHLRADLKRLSPLDAAVVSIPARFPSRSSSKVAASPFEDPPPNPNPT